MQQRGEYTIGADLNSVWQALNDPAMLQGSIPGCESLEQIDEQHLQASVRAKVGPVNAVFQVALALTNVQAPNGYTLNGDVKGGAGVAKGHADVNLEALPDRPDGPATRLVYQVEASVGGKLAQIGSRLIDGAAKKMADVFFSHLLARPVCTRIKNKAAHLQRRRQQKPPLRSNLRKTNHRLSVPLTVPDLFGPLPSSY